ncbi:hypothetical protein [Demequina litorisediminis]|uniref:hypothetical protein n=1 Tax=Demequina litorisediminis TaxID=1849022 RepID=UPI0024E13432|nr:hypothetical protein [Demequina litorisediminis]
MSTSTDATHANLEEALSEGISESTYRRRWAILATLCLGLMTAMIANMSLNLALPELAVEFSMTQAPGSPGWWRPSPWSSRRCCSSPPPLPTATDASAS